MNLNEQIDAAFTEEFAADPACSSALERSWAFHCYRAGYRAALRSLFTEVKSGDLQEGGIYHARWADQPMREVYYDGEQLCYWETGGIGPNGETEHIEQHAPLEDCEIREFVFPSPSDIFGEEGV